jgi:hypothetical protein
VDADADETIGLGRAARTSLSEISAMRFLIVAAFLLNPYRANASSSAPPNAIIQWNNATLQGIRDAKLGAPIVARALAMIHTCMYDAWAAYDDRAVGTQLHGALRRPASERTLSNKEQAVSFAAMSAVPARSITPRMGNGSLT